MEAGRSRRKFLKTALIAGGVILGGGALEVLNHLDYSSRKSDRSGSLIVTQSPSAIEIKYPGLHSTSLNFSIGLKNNSDATLESLVVIQTGVNGFEFEKAEISGAATTTTKVEGGLQIEPNSLPAEQAREIILHYRAGWDSITTAVKAAGRAVARYHDQGGFLPSFLDPYEADRSQDLSSEAPTVTVTIIPDPTALMELHRQGREDRLFAIRDIELLLQYPMKNEGVRDAYWKDPSNENGRRVVESLFSELFDAGEPYAELARELAKLPDLQRLFDDGIVKATENITCDALLDPHREKTEAMIRNMLDEGIKEKRRFCTPLQALCWISRKALWSENNNRLVPYDPNALLYKAWNFRDSNWNDFGAVTDRLNFPIAVQTYMARNIKYAYTLGEPEGVHSAKDVFLSKKGACYDHTVFAAYCLKKNGYDAKGMKLTFKNVVNGYFRGHILAIYLDPKDSMYYTIDEFGLNTTVIHGPFKSQREAAEYSCGLHPGAGLKDYSLHEVDLASGRYITTWT